MSQISILAILIATASYVVMYYAFFSENLFGKSLTSKFVADINSPNPVSSDKLLLVLIVGMLYCFFINLFMIMAERSGMADGIKTAFMLTIANFCIPAAIYFRMNGLSWDKFYRLSVFFLITHAVAGALIGLMS